MGKFSGISGVNCVDILGFWWVVVNDFIFGVVPQIFKNLRVCIIRIENKKLLRNNKNL